MPLIEVMLEERQHKTVAFWVRYPNPFEIQFTHVDHHCPDDYRSIISGVVRNPGEGFINSRR